MTAELEEMLEGKLLATGYDHCILGIAERCGQPDVVAYDTKAIIRSLVKDGMSDEEALDFFSFNISGAYVGELTPVFIHLHAKPRKKTDKTTLRKRSPKRQATGGRKTDPIRRAKKRAAHGKRESSAKNGSLRTRQRSRL